MDCFSYWHFLSCTVAQSVPHCWSIYFTQKTLCLPCSFLILNTWYIGIYTVDTLLYSLCFTNCIIPFLLQLLYHPQVFTWVLQPELLLKVITMTVNNWRHTILGYIVIASSKQILYSQSFSSNLLTIHVSLNVANTWPFQVLRCFQLFLFSNIVKRSHKKNYAPLIVTQNIFFQSPWPIILDVMTWL